MGDNLGTLSVTGRKRAEEVLDFEHQQLLSVFDSIDEPIYVSDPDTYEVLYVNQALRERAGYVVGWKCYRAFQGLECPCSSCTNKYIFGENTGEPYIWEYQNRLNRRWYHCIDKAISWPDGRVVRCEMAIDITERKQMEEDLLKIQKFESIATLAGGIAHDFNNILTAILGNISLAKIYLSPEDKALERLAVAERVSVQARDLTQQLLTFSKSGVPVLNVASIAELLECSASFVLRGSNTRCEFSMPDDLWPVEVDKGQISQVISNLIMNADQAMPEGGIIRLRAENIAVGKEDFLPLRNGKYVKISVEDQGIGMPDEHIQRIFDPYFTTKPKGNGLGLAISHSVIKRHGGHIAVESQLGIGSAFFIYLPASTGEILSEGKMEEKPIMGEGRILAIDDEEIIRDLAREMLTSIGYEAAIARDGAEALELYKKARELGHPFDAVVVDLTIPGGMGGAKIVKKIAQVDPEVKAIASSGYSDDPIMADFRKYGFSGVLAKPYRIRELSEVLHKVVNGATTLTT